jgi:ATP-dependent helicase/nuclease subunit A
LKRLVEEPPKEGEPPISLDEESVTVMTIHSAKGLEWPMILVLGMNHEGGGSYTPPYILDPDNGISLKVADHRTGELVRPPSWISAREDASAKEIQERKRLLYVACTRAKDHLVLSGAIPVRRDGVELEPHGMFKLLWDSMDLSIGELDEGVKLINEVPVTLVPVRPDDISEVEDEGSEHVDFHIAEEGSPLPLLKKVKPGEASYLLSPSRIIEKKDPRGIPTDFPRSSREIPPDEFGDIVHAILQGLPVDRILKEFGREENRDMIMIVVDAINKQMDMMDIETAMHEVEIVSMYGPDKEKMDPFLGRIDLLAKLKDGNYCIIDFKTGAPKESHKEQLAIYKELSKVLLTVEVSTRILYSEGHQ